MKAFPSMDHSRGRTLDGPNPKSLLLPREGVYSNTQKNSSWNRLISTSQV